MNVLFRWKITWLFFPINLKMVFVDYAYINLYLSRVLLEHLKYCHYDSFLDNTSSIFSLLTIYYKKYNYFSSKTCHVVSYPYYIYSSGLVIPLRWSTLDFEDLGACIPGW